MHPRRVIIQSRQPGPPIFPIIGLIVLVILIGGGYFAFETLRPLFAMTGQVVPRTGGPATPGPIVSPVAGATAEAPTLKPTSALDQPGAAVEINRAAATPGLHHQGRVNVLLLGSDNDTKFDGGALLTQSMIVVTIDPATKSVGMLSIPRDFWVRIPGYGYGKIDTAYEVGGIALARRVVEEDFGIPINYYAWVGLAGFVKVVDELGGVNLDVTHPVTDNQYPDDLSGADKYAYMRLYLPAGPQHLDGQTALQYVRSRHGDLVGDFGRSVRQQQVLLTLKKKAEQPGIVTKAPAMMQDLQDSVRTDFNALDVLEYANFARQINRASITQVVLSPPEYSTSGMAPDGVQAVVYPNWRAVDAVVGQLFALVTTPSSAARGDVGVVAIPRISNPQAFRPTATPTSRGEAFLEAAGSRPIPTETSLETRATLVPRATSTPTPRPAILSTVELLVQVQNGTAIPGLGLRATPYLVNNGYRTAAPVNADRTYQQTTVYSLDPTARDLASGVGRLLGAPVIQETGRARSAGPAIIVVLGSDMSRRF